MKALLRTDPDWASTILRLLLAAVIFPHGAQKVLGWFGGGGIAGTIGYFESAFGLPATAAALVMAAEFLGSLALLVGFLTRLAAFGVACVMAGAIYLVHLQVGFFMDWGGQLEGEGYEYHLLALAICLALMVAGGGRLSVDRALAGSPPPD